MEKQLTSWTKLKHKEELGLGLEGIGQLNNERMRDVFL